MLLQNSIRYEKALEIDDKNITANINTALILMGMKNNAKAKYNAEFMRMTDEEASKCGMGKKGGTMTEIPAGADEVEGGDTKFRDAVKLAVEEGKISTSLMQRRLGVGYGRAAKIIDTMEQMGYVSKPDGNKPRRVLLTAEEYSRRVMEGTLGESEE